MNKKANYLIVPELKLTIECCKGKATVEDSMEMKNREIADPNYDPAYNILIDFRRFETFIDNTTYESISGFVHYLKSLSITSTVAFLTTQPHQVVVGEFLKELSKEHLDIKIETFSTIEGSARYLGYSDNDIGLIEESVDEINKITD